MPVQPEPAATLGSLNAQMAAEGAVIHAKYGPHIGWAELQRILADRSCVRYPCEIVFDAAPLPLGEVVHPVARGARPVDGYWIYVHPFFLTRREQVPLLVLDQLVLVNHSGFATPEDAETFGATALGLLPNDYYTRLCLLVDQVEGCRPR
jgi:hypothetical protein